MRTCSRKGHCVLQKIRRRWNRIFLELLKMDSFRYYVCYYRWRLNQKKLRVFENQGSGVAKDTVSYNLSAFNYPGAAFGMAKRMSIIIYPIAAILRNNPNAKVLIIGPRTEDDILWAQSLGLLGTRGLDLFSYSDLIDIGDMHHTGWEAKTYDAILFGWVLAYSTQPEVAIAESKRLLKPGGYIAVGMESLSESEFARTRAERANGLNNTRQLIDMVKEDVIFNFDPGPLDSARDVGCIFRVS